jgi:hypothetical protein
MGISATFLTWFASAVPTIGVVALVAIMAYLSHVSTPRF